MEGKTLQQLQGMGAKPVQQAASGGLTLAELQIKGAKPVNYERTGYISSVVDAAKSGISQFKEGRDITSNSNNPLVMAQGGLKSAAGIVNTALSPIAPVFEPIGKAVDYVGNKISDIPEVQKFANSGLGNVTQEVASTVADLMTVASAVAGLESPKLIKGKIESAVPKIKKPSYVEKVIENRTAELDKLDTQYVQLRKAKGFSKDEGVASKKRIASTDVLDGAVDENGVIRTTGAGGAIDQYKAMTLDNAENVVRNNLEKEGGKTSLNEVQIRLEDSVKSSGLEGADLKVALNKVKQEISGLKLKADPEGNIPNTLLQDAKISQTKQINFQTPPEVSTYRKSIAKGYKTTIEKNSSFNVKEVNAELAKYLDDIAFLERLDGKRVQGGKLGKYFAQISGNIVGGIAGSAVGGPLGSAIGTVIGGELAGRIKGSAMSRTFGGETGMVAPRNAVLEKAIEQGKK